MSPRCWHSRTVTFDRNVAECVVADGGCGQKWVLDPAKGWQPVARINTAVFA